MGYIQKSKIHLDLSEFGDNNGAPFFADIKNPKMFSFEETAPFAAASKIKDEAERIKQMGILGVSLITEWNLLDKDTEAPLPCNDVSSLERIPALMAAKIINTLRPQGDQSSKNLLPQLDKSSVGDQLQKELILPNGTSTDCASSGDVPPPKSDEN
jgi:hypothetical protein